LGSWRASTALGALYQYGKYNVGPRYGWYVGWIYGFALLATVASVDSGAVLYIVDLINLWFKTDLNPSNHVTIFVIVALFFLISGALNAVGAKIMGRVANLGVYVETIARLAYFLLWRFTDSTRDLVFSLRPSTYRSPPEMRSASTWGATGG